MSPNMAVCIDLVKVADVTVDRIDHVTFAICDESRILGDNVIKCQSCHGGFRGFSLLQCKCDQGIEDGVVDPMSIP